MMTKEEKHTHVANLIKLAKADKELVQDEVIFIKSIAIKIGVDSSDFNNIALNVESVKEVTPVSVEVKARQFYDILTLMSIDQKADEEEENLSRELGGKLGFSKDQVERAITITKDNLEKIITPEQIAEIVGA
jgi:hypothetical protein